MSEYPEHEKQSKIKDLSQAIGEFIDFGLPAQGLALYERRLYDCECTMCEKGRAENARFHTDEEIATAVDGKVQIARWVPTHRTIMSILAQYFEIDQDKIDAEKDDMLRRLRA